MALQTLFLMAGIATVWSCLGACRRSSSLGRANAPLANLWCPKSPMYTGLSHKYHYLLFCPLTSSFPSLIQPNQLLST